jgi:arginase
MNVEIIVVPYDSGHRGVRMGRGPEHLLERGLVDALSGRGAEVLVHDVAPPRGVFPTEMRVALELQRVIAERVRDARAAGHFALVLSGNCNSALGTTMGLRAATGASPFVWWFDAHGDFNTPETTIGGFLDGMALAMLAGHCWRNVTSHIPGFVPVAESDIVMIGTRQLDPLERDRLDASRVRVVAPGDWVSFDASKFLDGSQSREMYLHLDLDSLDPSEGRANEFAPPGGLSRDTFLRAVRSIMGSGRVSAAAITAYDPESDTTGSVGRIAIDAAAALITQESGG